MSLDPNGSCFAQRGFILGFSVKAEKTLGVFDSAFVPEGVSITKLSRHVTHRKARPTSVRPSISLGPVMD